MQLSPGEGNKLHIMENTNPSTNSERSVSLSHKHYLYISVLCCVFGIYVYLFQKVLYREFEVVRESMNSAITMKKTEVIDAVLNDFSEVN